MKIKGVIFDLDGVITDTAKYHFAAWKKCAKSLNIEIPNSFEDELKGIDRRNSLLRILKFGNVILTEEEIEQKMNEKNNYYVESLQSLTENDILPGILQFISSCKEKSIKIALASASKNATKILEKLNLLNYFDYIADVNKIVNPKPAPDIFLDCVKGIKLNIEDCIGIEDAPSGIEAINKAKIFSIGIGNLENANQCFSSTSQLNLDSIEY